MKNYDMRIFLFYLISINFFIIHDSFYVSSLKLRFNQENSADNKDEEIKNEILKKIRNQPELDKLDYISIENTDLNDLINRKSSEIDEEANWIKSFDKEGSVSGLKIRNPSLSKNLERDYSKVQKQTCDQIKKLGKQRYYCESKFISHKEEKTIECIKTFCNTCCEQELNCIDTCNMAHSLYENNDPEELFLDVCSYKKMGKSFHGFCENIINGKNKEDYQECFRNFCFDCCSNELKISDFMDPEITKCMKICQPKEKEEISIILQENVGVVNDHKDNAIKEENLEKKDLSELLGIKASQAEEDQKQTFISKNPISNLELRTDDNLKTIKFNKNILNNISNNKQIFIENNQDIKDNEDIGTKREFLKKVLVNDNNKENKILNINQKIGKEIHEEEMKAVQEKLRKEKFEEKNQIKIENIGGHKNNSKICDKLLLSNPEINHFGKDIHKLCEVDFKLNSYGSKSECLNNLCLDCCKVLNGDYNKKCYEECMGGTKNEIDILIMKPFVRVDSTQRGEENDSKKFSKLKNINSNFPEIQKVEELMKKEKDKKVLDKGDDTSFHKLIFSHNEKNHNGKQNLEKVKMEHNHYFSIIHTVCKIDYFKDCNDLLCSDFCFNSETELIENCNSKCRKSIFDDKAKETTGELVEFIMKRFFLYRNKNEILFDGNNKKDSNSELNKTNIDIHKSVNFDAIENVKKRIDELRKKLMDEETNLLNLYKLKI